jgi:SAM-dependent methyltransferase
MPATERIRNEQQFHDRQSQHRAADFALRPNSLYFPDDAYLDHETWIRPALAQLGDVAGRRVLDFGCGHGMAAVVLARRGANLTAFDLSGGYLKEARRRAEANRTAITFIQADGERLPFADASFDRIWGNAVLHHVDLSRAGPELFRVLSPGGVAIFCEPWGENPLLNLARRRLAYPGKEHTPDERPLRQKHLRILHSVFSHVEVRGYQLLSMVRRLFRAGKLISGLDCCDAMLLAWVPALQRFCRYVVITLKKASGQ